MHRVRDVSDLPVGDDAPLALTAMVRYDVPVSSTSGVGVEFALNRRPTPAEVDCDREALLVLGSGTITSVVQVGEMRAGMIALNDHLGRVSHAARVLGEVRTTLAGDGATEAG